MSDRSSGVSRWVRGLFGSSDEPPKFPGKESRNTGTRTVLSTEGLACDAICRLSARPSLPVSHNVFGRAVADTVVDRAGGAVATATGLAMYGKRVAAFVPAGRIAEWRDAVRSATDRHVPLVVHASLDPTTHASYHAAADLGPLVALARDAQQAADLSLIIRRAAEMSLAPGIVAVDPVETSWGLGVVRIPDPDLVRAYVGDPGENVECPTPAQALLFDESRRRVPRWFDLDRPSAHGVAPDARNVDAVAAGRNAYFSAHVLSILDECMRDFEVMTGHPAPSFSGYRLDDAKHVLIAQGSAIAVAEAVAQRLRGAGSARIGVLGVTWLRPFPADAIRDVLARVEVATVLERTDETPVGTPSLLGEVATALRGKGPRLLSATYDQPSEAEFAAVCSNMQAGESAVEAVRLGVSVPEVTSDFPKREVLWQRLRRDYPDIARATLPVENSEEAERVTGRSFVMRVRDACPPVDTLEVLADALGPDATGRVIPVGPDVWDLTVSLVGTDTPARIVLASADLLKTGGAPFGGQNKNDALIVATDLGSQDLWPAIPASWRDEIRSREITVYATHDEPGSLISAAVSVLSEGKEGLEEVVWQDLSDPPKPVVEAGLPLVVRRFGETTARYDSVARFWGEYAQPRQAGKSLADAPDPYLALGAVPVCTSTFVDRTDERDRVPQIDPSVCTGCGKCWAACPDSAIAPTALGAEAFLNAAADRADKASRDEPSPAAARLRRAHKQIAAHLDTRFAEQGPGAVSEEVLRESFDWLVDKMKPAIDEIPALQDAFDKTIAGVVEWPLTVSEPFFREPHRDTKGSGTLLMLCIDPRSCQACGLCSAVCPEQAIRMESQTAEAVDGMRTLWSAWEQLPDTAGKTVARAAGHPEVGPLPAILLSRHCLLSMPGGDGAEPGSGERLAARQVAAVVEYQMQRRAVARLEGLNDLTGRLREAIRDEMAKGLPVGDLDHLDEALSSVSTRTADAGPILSRLEALGEKAVVDTTRVQDLVHAAQDVERQRFGVAEGSRGIGRARFGLVIAGRTAAGWAAGFPHNPFAVPLTVDLTGHGADLALGLARGLVEERTAEVRAERRAQLLLEAPADLKVRERELETLGWQDLTPEERSICPPVLVIAGDDALTGPGLAGLSALLSSDLPVKVVLLDGMDLLSRRADPTLTALAHRHAFVLASSIAHTDHLFHGLTAALDMGGPAMIHIHAPSPGRHGFATDETLNRASLAVASRVHPLLRYDPGAEGVFGLRLSLDGNPGIDKPWIHAADEAAELTPAQWAAGEARFERAFEETSDAGKRADLDRAERWASLQEMAGAVTPFADRLRERLERELGDAHRAEITALKVEYEAKLADLEASQQTDQAQRLRDRLMQLAGFRKPS